MTNTASKNTTQKVPTEKIILTDVDGVLLDFPAQMTVFLNEQKNANIKLEDWQKSYWIHDLLGCTVEEASQMAVEFSHSDYFKHLPAKECALEAVENLANDGWRFIAITAAGTGCGNQDVKRVHSNRFENLEKHFGSVFDDLHITNFRNCKGPKLEEFDSAWWIEDSVSHANAGHDIGHKSIIIESNHYDPEKNIYNLPLVKTWHEIEALVRSGS